MRRVSKTLASVSMLGAAALFLTGLNGCDMPTDNKDSASVTIETINPINIAAGSNSARRTLGGKVKGDPQIDEVSFSIIYDGEDVTGDGAVVIDQGGFIYSNESSADLEDVDLVVYNTACNGTYTLKINVEAGAGSGGNSVTFEVSGATDCGEQPVEELTEVQVTLGSRQANEGSSLDADEMVVYQLSDLSTSADRKKIDAYFSDQAAPATEPWVMSTENAADQSLPPMNWDEADRNNNRFIELPSSIDFDAVTTQDQIDQLWSDNVADAVIYAAISTGDVILIETNLGNYRIMHVESAENSGTGTAVLKGKL